MGRGRWNVVEVGRLGWMDRVRWHMSALVPGVTCRTLYVCMCACVHEALCVCMRPSRALRQQAGAGASANG